MEGVRLILMDGTTIEDGRAGYSGGFLWLYFSGYTLPEAALMLFDPNKTGKIAFQYGEMQDDYEGFTVCTSLSIDMDGAISACLKRGE